MLKEREGRKALPKALEASASMQMMRWPCVGGPDAGHVSVPGREPALERCEKGVPGRGLNAAGLEETLSNRIN
jgi:hypothetical protein